MIHEDSLNMCLSSTFILTPLTQTADFYKSVTKQLPGFCTFAYAANEMCGNVLVVYSSRGQVQDHVSGRPLAVSGDTQAMKTETSNSPFNNPPGLPARRGGAVLLGVRRVLLRPGAEQDGVTAARLGHHELRQSLRTRIHRQTVHLRDGRWKQRGLKAWLSLGSFPFRRTEQTFPGSNFFFLSFSPLLNMSHYLIQKLKQNPKSFCRISLILAPVTQSICFV